MDYLQGDRYFKIHRDGQNLDRARTQLTLVADMERKMQQMQDMGLFLRGVKTKLKDNGDDYYGIIRESTSRSIPSAIIEHCHVDESRDTPYCQTEEDWKKFGREDALSVAKYFGLSSD